MREAKLSTRCTRRSVSSGDSVNRSGVRWCCIRTCDQIRSTGSRITKTVAVRTPRSANPARIERSRDVGSRPFSGVMSAVSRAPGVAASSPLK